MVETRLCHFDHVLLVTNLGWPTTATIAISSHRFNDADPWPHESSPRYLPSLSDHTTVRNAYRKFLRQVSFEPILAESLFDLPFTLVDLPAVQAKNDEIGFFFLAFATGHSQRRSMGAPSGAEAHHQQFRH